jgi:hypothetical protein
MLERARENSEFCVIKYPAQKKAVWLGDVTFAARFLRSPEVRKSGSPEVRKSGSMEVGKLGSREAFYLNIRYPKEKSPTGFKTDFRSSGLPDYIKLNIPTPHA